MDAAAQRFASVRGVAQLARRMIEAEAALSRVPADEPGFPDELSKPAEDALALATQLLADAAAQEARLPGEGAAAHYVIPTPPQPPAERLGEVNVLYARLLTPALELFEGEIVNFDPCAWVLLLFFDFFFSNFFEFNPMFRFSPQTSQTHTRTHARAHTHTYIYANLCILIAKIQNHTQNHTKKKNVSGGRPVTGVVVNQAQVDLTNPGVARARAAVANFEAALSRYPGRLNSLIGLARAHSITRNATGASNAYRQVIRQTQVRGQFFIYF
jgi:hypothetical protein